MRARALRRWDEVGEGVKDLIGTYIGGEARTVRCWELREMQARGNPVFRV